MRLLSEPTAAAVAYGCNPKRELPKEGEDPINVLIMDMGHSNLQASMCQFVKGSVKVSGAQHTDPPTPASIGALWVM